MLNVLAQFNKKKTVQRNSTIHLFPLISPLFVKMSMQKCNGQDEMQAEQK